ncbi:acyltransferase family protein [Azospirillum halopraeferens]|uniref:acyltransferase family protein n=1 Tax=Azospirillum halopraeferens TaxID=34010 RepID=UPI00041B959A|nr:acyltransferase [Azospirillum halopraeferens]
MDRRQRLDSLTALRFFLALGVFLFHYRWIEAHRFPAGESALINVLNQGHFGVSGFFLLSGFILAWNYHGDGAPVDRAAFWWHRVARIYPVYLAGLALLFVAALAGVPGLYDVRAGSGALGDLLLNLVMVQAWHEPAAMSWNGVNWTLSVEAFFYLLFPVLIGAMGRLGPAGLVAVVAGAAALGAGLDLLHRYAPFSPPGDRLFALSHVFPPARLAEFVAGIAGCLLVLRWRPAVDAVVWRRAALIVGAAIVAVLTLRVYGTTGQRVLLLPFLALIVALAIADRAGARTHPVPVRLGEWSFALYIVHQPVLHALAPITAALPSAVALPLALAVSLGVSALVYHGIEVPARRRLLALRQRQPRPVRARP